MNSAEIIARLRDKFPLGDGWIGMSEVTPPGTSRRFDFVAIMGWSSRGHEVQGFEIKVARSDWLRELKEPAKAEPLASLCTRWWIVAPPGVVKVEELPPAWGLLVVHPEQIRTGKQAPCLSPAPWTDAVWRCFLLRLVTREGTAESEIELARIAGMMEGETAERKRSEKASEYAKRTIDGLEATIQKAQRALGIHLHEAMDFPLLGKAFAMLRSNDLKWRTDALVRDAERLEELAKEMREAAAELTPRESADVS